MTVATTMFPGRRPAAFRARPAASSTASPFTTLPAAETKMARSASPSKATPKSAPWATTAACKLSRWSAPQLRLILRPSGRAANGNHFRAQPAEQFRREPERCAIAAIDGNLHAVQSERRNAQQEIEVLPAQVVFRGKRQGRGLDTRGQQAEDLLFDQVLFGIRQLEAVMAEHLQAVVLVRIVRRRNHHAGHERTGAREVGHAGRRDYSGVAYARALAGQPSGHHFRDPRTALARVRADQNLRMRGMGGSVFAQRDSEGVDRRRV